jgi:hypothetical protein
MSIAITTAQVAVPGRDSRRTGGDARRVPSAARVDPGWRVGPPVRGLALDGEGSHGAPADRGGDGHPNDGQTSAQEPRRYDVAHERLLTLLGEVRDQEWPLPTALPDGTPRTMETVFRQPTYHFAEHSAWVRETLGR